jgi:hypothetical protein
MIKDNIEEMAKNGSEKSFIDLLKAIGNNEMRADNGRGDFTGYAIDVVIEGASKDEDEDEARKSRKLELIAAFQAKEGIFRSKECIGAEEIAKASSEEGFVNLLKSSGDKHLDDIVDGAAKDEDKARKSMKMTLVAAYKAKEGVFKIVEVVKADKKFLKKLAFKGESERVAELLKAHADDKEAVQAIIKGAQKDIKKRFFRAASPRQDHKREVLTEYFAQTGRFAPA